MSVRDLLLFSNNIEEVRLVLDVLEIEYYTDSDTIIQFKNFNDIFKLEKYLCECDIIFSYVAQETSKCKYFRFSEKLIIGDYNNHFVFKIFISDKFSINAVNFSDSRFSIL